MTVRNVVLFGAGASHGSDVSDMPPLTGRLFDELAKFNPPGWGSLDQQTAANFRHDFEEATRKLSESNPHAMPPLQRAMAAYFFRFVPRSTNLYVNFAGAVSRCNWTGAVVTLNYDRLLELALLTQGVRPYIGPTGPGVDHQVELCLPHGCCHIFSSVGRGAAGAVNFAGPHVRIAAGVPEVIGDPVAFRARIEGDAFPPVMCYFDPAKRTTTGWELIEAQKRRFAELLEGADRVAVIGIRVRSWDNHIWGPLGRTAAEVLYCAGETAANEYERWAADARPTRKDTVLQGYFREELNQILAYVGLR